MIEIGQRFHYLAVTGRARKNGRLLWEVKCDCGTKKIVQQSQLVGAERPIKSCGCKKVELIRASKTGHGGSVKSAAEYKTFITWQSMLWRCYNKNRADYACYGGRGIDVCERWRNNFSAFLEDMGLKPKGFSLGRINNEVGYSKQNCRWETAIQQARNKRSNHFIELGKKRMTITEWSEHVGLTKSTIQKRISNGWSVALTLSTPARRQKNSKCNWLEEE